MSNVHEQPWRSGTDFDLKGISPEWFRVTMANLLKKKKSGNDVFDMFGLSPQIKIYDYKLS